MMLTREQAIETARRTGLYSLYVERVPGGVVVHGTAGVWRAAPSVPGLRRYRIEAADVAAALVEMIGRERAYRGEAA